jgi:hypothetical protein
MQPPSWLKSTWRVLRWLLLAVLLLALALVAALWWVNRNDDPLRPEVAALLKFEPPSPEAMRGNGYFTMLGLGAPAGEDAFEAGKRFFQVQLKEYEELRRTGHYQSYIEQAPANQSIDIKPMSCPPGADDCYAYYLAHADEIRTASAKYAVAIDRYLSLLDTPDYVEMPMPSFVVAPPYYGHQFAAAELVMMQATLLLNGPRRADGLALLARNAQIQQRTMSGSRSLIGAMIALAVQVRQQRLLSSALRHMPDMAGSSTLPLTLRMDRVDLSAAFKGELAETLDVHRMIAKGNPFISPQERTWVDDLSSHLAAVWTRLVYLPNATMNAFYQDRQLDIALARLPASQLDTAAAAARSELEKRLQTYWYPIPLPLRNPTGEALRHIHVAAPRLAYIERAHDVEAHRRLVQLQIKALQERVPLAQMPTWLAAQPPELRNPYTLQPMGWDAATQALVFEGRQPNNQNPEPRHVFRVPIGPVATAAH